MIKTAIYSGSFNPIHIGHLALANWICEYTDVDELWFLVSPHNPIKKADSLLPDTYRLELLRMAIGSYPKFKISDIEFTLPRPSYTIHTLNKLSELYPDRAFTLVIGADSWNSFHQWKSFQQIIDQYPVMVYPRSGYNLDIDRKPSSVTFVDAPLISISSTFIRQSIVSNKDIRFFLPESLHEEIPRIKDYIHSLG